jgi:2-C-methyl-D-erythritol 2,4-cyclodiphosphate synthase
MFRVGLGHDTHRLVENNGTGGNGIILGGIRIEHNKQLLGHSDADVVLHAITDALLGAAGLEDIGQLFPDTASENRGRDSSEMLTTAWQKVRQSNWTIVNLDTIIFAQRPKIATYKEAMRKHIAAVLEIEPEQVSIKGKTGEHIGIIGREEAISAECVVLLSKKSTAE